MENKREIRHKEAFDKWYENNKKGLIQAATGFGKSKVAINILKEEVSNNKKLKVLLLSPTHSILENWKSEFEYWKFDYNKYKIDFQCYQSAYKFKDNHYNLVIADEIHNSLDNEYEAFFHNNTYDSILSLSAEVPKDKLFNLTKISPVVYNYSLNQGIEDGFIAPFDVYVILHTLDDKNKYIQSGSKKVTFFTTELKQYKYLTSQIFAARFAKNVFYERKLLGDRMRLVYNLESKDNSCKILIEELAKRGEFTLVFTELSKSLDRLTENGIHSNKSEEENNKIKQQFIENSINTIGSCKMLKEGVTLSTVNNIILHSFNSKTLNFIQRIGRGLRYEENKKAKIFIYKTLNTVEEKWFENMIKSTNFNIKYLSTSSVDFKKDLQNIL